ncbi:MAG TPA: transcriptional repressor LexA [Anaerolineaceae bacterium]|nr:transcriptional repressor LexA [Anaerolineaceae bacterium]HPN53417.1 transcriptional repressor LexA [Anaerolineaceae bacterium]
MGRKKEGLGERHKRILSYLESYQKEFGYPPSIREICDSTNISSTSVVNYYLEQLEEMGYIVRENHISRGIRVIKSLENKLKESAQAVVDAAENLIRLPHLGNIVAGQPINVPSIPLQEVDMETNGIDIARSMLPSYEKPENLYALSVKGDSMIDAMINDGDIVIMRTTREAHNGEMVAVWLTDREETTLKYYFHEPCQHAQKHKAGHVRLQPANSTMDPIIIDDPSTVEIHGKVVMVIRRPQTLH